MRMNLALLDWVCKHSFTKSDVLCYITTLQNENVGRDSTSERLYWDMRRPDRRTPMKVLVEKSYRFTTNIWSLYMQKNAPDVW